LISGQCTDSPIAGGVTVHEGDMHDERAKRLDALELTARRLEPLPAERSRIAAETVSYVDAFIESLPGEKAYAGGTCEGLRNVRVTESGKPFAEVFGYLRDEMNRVGINSSSGAGFGYIPGGGIWMSAVADFIAAATNRYAGVSFSSPGAVMIENQMIRWLCSIIGYPPGAHGNLTSGGSIANLTAIQAARDASGITASNAGKSVIYATAHVHHCIHKALHTTGLDEAVRRTVPTDPRYRMDPSALEQLIAADRDAGMRPFLVIATAGTTDTGAVDPLEPIADLCASHQAWFHVDAAYGGFFILVDELRGLFKGIERADSVVMDPHKGMFLPFGSGAALLKDGTKLTSSYVHDAPYMQDAIRYQEISPADAGPELSRHFRGLRMWLPLQVHGVAPFRANLEEKMLLCRQFVDGVRALGFETGPEPELSVAMFRYPGAEGNAFNRRLLEAIQEDGRSFFSSTEIDGTFWIRCAVLNFRSHIAEIRLALDVIGANLKNLLDSRKSPL